MSSRRPTQEGVRASDAAPSPFTAGGQPGILRALAAVTRAHPTERKRLVAPDVNYGRELLVALACWTGGWVGWEATNLRGLAEELAFITLAEHGRTAGSDIEIGALVNRALDQAIDSRRVTARFATLAHSIGFRRALLDALLGVRTAGVSVDDVRRSAQLGSPGHDLAAVLEAYERLLSQSGLADAAAVFQLGLESFEQEAPYVLDGVTVLVPSLSTRGLAGRLVERLLEYGAQILATDHVIGVEPPAQFVAHRVSDGAAASGADDVATGRSSALSWLSAPELPAADDPRLDHTAVQVDLFSGATPSEELREVCRRVVAEGHKWDEVEIATTDVDTYGIALDALCQPLGIGATTLHGLPLARTRLGRALDRWLGWLENGLPVDVLREALEAGELRVAGSDVASTVLARELRRLRIGWGRARYASALEALTTDDHLATLVRREDESDEEFQARTETRRRAAAALSELLRVLLACTPPVPERGDERSVRSSCATLAQATLGWLALVPLHGMPEEQTVARLRTRLEQLAAIEEGDVAFSGALAALRDALSDLRAWPLVTDARKPWSAAGGMLHLTDITHAGTTGRRRTFVVGLDADRTAGGSRQDPLLPDSVRRVIAETTGIPGVLATTADRREESAYVLASALATLRGRVTLSYATSGSLDGREAGPSSVLLQAWRLIHGDRTLSYEALRDALRPPAAAVPARGASLGTQLLDARDVWLDAIADGALLLDGDPLVREAFPGLGAGLRAAEIAASGQLTGYHGLVPQAVGVLDPTARVGVEISPSALEKLSACPLAWFYRYGLGLYAPDDPEYDAERWLDALQRGSLLHEVFERFTRGYQDRQDEIVTDAARVYMLTVVADAIARWREQVPPPGEAVFETEAEELRRAALAFLQMERELVAAADGGRWTHFEYEFGVGVPPGPYVLPDGRVLSVKGRVDRVDELPDCSFRVVDYKTGKVTPYAKDPKAGPFNGGRQLQPALYAAALTSLHGIPVSRFEYRFPTERGGNEIIAYTAEELEDARGIVNDLVEHVRTGAFVPTTDSHDCGFCDYQTICRARRGNYNTDSPRATWAAEHAPALDAYRTMLIRRTPDGAAGDKA